MEVLEKLDFTYGIVANEGITLDAGLLYPFLSSAFLYANVGLKYGQHAYYSIPGTEDYHFSSDVGLFLKTGIGFVPFRNFRIDTILGFDYTYLGNDMPGNRNLIYPYIGLVFVYDDYHILV